MDENTVIARISHLLKTGDMSDVTFAVGCSPNQKIFKLHKLILFVNSDKFHDMFLKYRGVPMERINLEEIEPPGFEVMVRCLYTREFSAGNIREATYAYLSACKCDAIYVKEQSLSYITRELRRCTDNVFLVLEKATEFNEWRLKSQCEKLIAHKCEEILGSAEFLRASPSFLQGFLQMHFLLIKSELCLFNAILAWAKAACERNRLRKTPANLRTILNNLLPHIRFLTMTAREFYNGPAISYILTIEEADSIAWKISYPNTSKKSLPFWCNNSTSERSSLLGQVYFCCYYASVPNRIHIDSMEIKCSIKVNLPVRLVGVTLYACSLSTVLPGAMLEVICDGRVVGSGQVRKYNVKTKILAVYLSEPVQLKIGNFYSVEATFTCFLHLCGSKVRKRIDSRECNVIFDVNPQLPEKPFVWEAWPHFRGFLYHTCL